MSGPPDPAQTAAGRRLKDLEAGSRQRKDLLGQVGADPTLSDVTKKELELQLQGEVGTGDVSAASTIFKKAKEGLDPRFRSRQLKKQQRSVLADRPGRAQTVLSR